MRFILGKPGTGKTSLCLQEIQDSMGANAPLYFLVPEQFSLQGEKLLLLDRVASTKVQVLSFNRLAYRLFSAFGGKPGKLADDLGKQLILRKVLFEVGDKLTYYKSSADKHGFVDSLARTITEMNQYCITSADLFLRAQGASGTFSAKLFDIATIAECYRNMVADKYLLTDDMLDILCQRLNEEQGEIPLLDGAFFWVDGFVGFTPQERRVLQYIKKRAARVTVTLTTDLQEPTFSPTQITLAQLQDNGHEKIILEENFRHVTSPTLAHFVSNFNILQNREVAKQPNTDGISIIAAPERYASVNTAASIVLDLVQKEGYKFRDIAILCGDRTHYEKVLQATFDRLHIPLFVDSEADILAHPLTELIRSGLEIIVRNFSYESVFRFIKTRLVGIALTDIDVLENYCLQHGISSYRWGYPFHNPVAEAARLQLMEVLEPFASKKKGTVEELSRHIFDMLYSLNAPETLQRWYDNAVNLGEHNLAKIHKQIWPKLCEIFDKLVEMLGTETVSVSNFAKTLDAGFAQANLGRVPPTTNQVVLGDMGRSRYPEIRAMIVLGANENVLPAAPGQSGLFTDQERKNLRNEGVELAAESIFRVAEDNHSLYCALSQPKEKLYILYSDSETNGRPLRPSPIVARLLEMFPNLSVQKATDILEFGEVADAKEPASHLSPEMINELYGGAEIITAATRLEAFARCPFQFFLTYVLKARERKRFEILSSDVGILFHDVLANFSKRFWEGGDSDFSRAEISQYVDEIIGILTTEANLYHDTARNRHVLNKVRRVSTASIWALCQHIKAGEFVPTLAEHEIRTSTGIPLANGKNLKLTGVVDRVDTLNLAGEEFLKIIDYKSGSTKFNMEEVRQGVQLQLMLYMNVLTALRGAKPGGIFYFPIDDPLITTDEILPDDVRDQMLLKQYKMSGIALDDSATITALDKGLTAGNSSDVVPIAINKDGRYKKTAQPTAISIDEFIALGADVHNKVQELGERITGGEIAAQPYTKGHKSPCNFCGFTAICGRG